MDPRVGMRVGHSAIGSINSKKVTSGRYCLSNQKTLRCLFLVQITKMANIAYSKFNAALKSK